MKKIVINVILSFLFSITLVLSTFCLTALNKNFVIHIMDKKDYYREVYQEIKDDFDKRDVTYELTYEEVKEDIQKYVKSRYKNDYYRFSNQDLRDDYNKYIKLNNYFTNYDVCSMVYLLYFIDFIFIVVTGVLFLKTKKVHSLSIIIISNFIVTVILFGIVTIFVNVRNPFVDMVLTKYNHYYLATSIILLELTFANIIKKRLWKS